MLKIKRDAILFELHPFLSLCCLEICQKAIQNDLGIKSILLFLFRFSFMPFLEMCIRVLICLEANSKILIPC